MQLAKVSVNKMDHSNAEFRRMFEDGMRVGIGPRQALRARARERASPGVMLTAVFWVMMLVAAFWFVVLSLVQNNKQ